MPVSPQDFSIWARSTGNKYPSSLEEKARLAPEVHSFMRNFGKQGAVGEEPEQKSSTLENIGKAALVAGGIAAGVAAARDPRVQTAVKDFATTAADKASGIRENVQSFLTDLGTKRVSDPDVIRNSGDVTPGPIVQQSSNKIVSDPWQEPTVPMPQNRDLASEATALAGAMEQIRSSKGQVGEPSRQALYESIIAKYPDPGVGRDVQFKPEHRGISTGAKSVATDPVSGQKYRVGGGTSLEEAKGLVVGELGDIRGDVKYVAPEATTDTTNSLFSAPITPDNRMPKAETFNPNSLTGQHNIEQAADNIRDLAGEATALANALSGSVSSELSATEIARQDIASLREKGLTPTIDRPSIQAALAEVMPTDIEEAPLYERTVANIGPEAGITKAASGTSIRGRSRIASVPSSVERQRQLFGTEDPLVPGVPMQMGPDVPGNRPVSFTGTPEETLQEYAKDLGLTKPGMTGDLGGGVGIYGIEPAFAAGAISSETGEYTEAAKRKPTDVVFKSLGDITHPFHKLSNEDLGMLTQVGSPAEQYNAEKVLKQRRSVEASEGLRRIQAEGGPNVRQRTQEFLKQLEIEQG